MQADVPTPQCGLALRPRSTKLKSVRQERNKHVRMAGPSRWIHTRIYKYGILIGEVFGQTSNESTVVNCYDPSSP